MRFYRNLYISDKIKHPGILQWRLKRHAGRLDVYVIALCSTDEPGRPAAGDNQFEFYHNAALQQPYFRRHTPYIIGLASGRGDAIQLCARIVQEAVAATGSADVYPYLFPSGLIAEYFAS